MSEHVDRARRYHEGIRPVLLHDWDPIGVADVAEAQDEYDSYIGKLYGMLIRDEPRHKLVDHLSASFRLMCLALGQPPNKGMQATAYGGA